MSSESESVWSARVRDAMADVFWLTLTVGVVALAANAIVGGNGWLLGFGRLSASVGLVAGLVAMVVSTYRVLVLDAVGEGSA